MAFVEGNESMTDALGTQGLKTPRFSATHWGYGFFDP